MKVTVIHKHENHIFFLFPHRPSCWPLRRCGWTVRTFHGCPVGFFVGFLCFGVLRNCILKGIVLFRCIATTRAKTCKCSSESSHSLAVSLRFSGNSSPSNLSFLDPKTALAVCGGPCHRCCVGFRRRKTHLLWVLWKLLFCLNWTVDIITPHQGINVVRCEVGKKLPDTYCRTSADDSKAWVGLFTTNAAGTCWLNGLSKKVYKLRRS